MPTRNYKDEYKLHHSSTKAKKDRAARNKARRQANKKGKAQGKDIDHKKPLRNNGSRHLTNTRTRSVKANRSDNGHKPGEKQRKHK